MSTTSNSYEHQLSHTIMAAQLQLHQAGVTASAEASLRASIRQAQKALSELRQNG